jgi:hypothetical protein
MKRFEIFYSSSDQLHTIEELLIKFGYKEVPNSTCGDEDFICIDNERMEYIWCEDGFFPFCSLESLENYQGDVDASLSYLDHLRN